MYSVLALLLHLVCPGWMDGRVGDGDDVNDGDRGIILKFPWPYLFDVLVVPFDLTIG